MESLGYPVPEPLKEIDVFPDAEVVIAYIDDTENFILHTGK